MTEQTIPLDHSIFNSRICFQPLITSLKKTAEDNPGAQKLYSGLIKSFESLPELLEPIEDMAILEKHSELVEMLLTTVFPPTNTEADNFYAVSMPFHFKTIYSSKIFHRAFLKPGTNEFIVPDEQTAHNMYMNKLQHAYRMVLEKYGGLKAPQTARYIYPATDPVTGLKKYFEVLVDPRFVDVRTSDRTLPKIPENVICSRTNRVMELTELLKKMPLNNFVFEGLVIIRINDVTEQETISEIKNELLNINAYFDASVYESLQSHMRSLLGLKEIKIGITPFFKVSGHFVFSELHNSNSLLFKHFTEVEELDEVNQCCQQLFYGSDGAIAFETLDEKALKEIDYLRLYYEAGARSLILCPLRHNNELIGVVEILSEEAGKLNNHHIAKMEAAIPLFTLALAKTAENLETQIDKVIKEKFTAVQPAVEWKFTEVAWNYIRSNRLHEDVKIERICFDNVYPLYAAIDIRNSSTERSHAIQLDLVEQLNMVQDIIQKAQKELHLPLLQEIAFKIRKYIASASDILLSDEEIMIHDFLHGHVVSVLNHLSAALPSIKNEIDGYFAKLDPESGLIYHHRREFEESITKINDVVSRFIDREQLPAQQVYPHYFERYVTDGVEFNVYIGQSIAPQRPFNDIYLQNLKMWQLTILVKAARLAHKMETELSHPLQTAQLILANSMPISVSFRSAERKFDVDSAYNIRYEIIKKRIDKVRIKGSNERLTQPGKIAIVYGQPKEAVEYGEYIEFLQNQKLLKPGIEHLELEELQGVIGLKALRVEIDWDEAVKQGSKIELSSTTSRDLLKESEA